MSADLFHVTRIRDAKDIAREGLKRGSPSPAEKKGRELAGESDRDFEMAEDQNTVKADRAFDELLADAKYAVEGAKEYPSHEYGVFFWPTKKRAYRAESDTNWTGTIVAVDSDALPPDCRPVRGDIEIADGIWDRYWQRYSNYADVDEDALYEEAKLFWQTASWYDGTTTGSDDEVWVGCDVPPEAIEYIENADGRVLYEPVDADQATLEEFVNGG
jgi:hypothetical protein